MKRQIKYLPFYLLISWFLYGAFSRTIENYRLSNKGVFVKAVITEVKKVGSKGTIRCFYYYTVSGIKYSGFDDTEILNSGDTILVLYLPANPEVNRSKRFIEEDL